jgi:hypothetical protein
VDRTLKSPSGKNEVGATRPSEDTVEATRIEPARTTGFERDVNSNEKCLGCSLAVGLRPEPDARKRFMSRQFRYPNHNSAEEPQQLGDPDEVLVCLRR